MGDVLIVLLTVMILQKTDRGHLLQHLIQVLFFLAGQRNHILQRIWCAHFHFQRDLHHFIVEDIHKAGVLRTCFIDLFQPQFVGNAVGNLFTEQKQVFFVGNHVSLSFIHDKIQTSIV